MRVTLACLVSAAAGFAAEAPASHSVPGGDGLYKLTSSNKPATETPLRPSPREVLHLLDQPFAPSAPPALGGGSQVYKMDATQATNALENALTPTEWVRLTASVEDAERMFHERRTDEAVAALQSEVATEVNPIVKGKLHNRMAAYLFKSQRYDEALVHMRESARINPGDSATLCNVGAVLLSMGRVEESDAFLRKVDTAKIDNLNLLFSVYFNKACIGSLRKNKDEALLNLIRAAQSDPRATLTALSDPQLDNVRNSLEFMDLKSRLEILAREESGR